jgi:hypothetical protein
VKVPALVAGMVAGADCIDGMDPLRHGGMDRPFGPARAPSTLGTFLRSFSFGHVRQLDAVASRLLVNLASHTPILAGADQVAFVDVDDTVRETHGYAKQGRRVRLHRHQGPERADRHGVHPDHGAGDHGNRLRRWSANSAHGAPGWSPTRWPPRGGPAPPGW